MGKKFKSVFSDQNIEEHIQDYKDRVKNGGGDGEGKYPTYLSIEADDTVEVRFLEKEPIKFWQHRVWDSESKKGKGGNRVFSCTREPDCPLCAAGNSPTFKAAWQVVHVDNVESGKVVPKVKLWVQGIRFAELLHKKASKYDITKENIGIERIGEGQNTQYSVDRTGEKTMPKYDVDEVRDLEEVFGLDDEKIEDMERIASEISNKKSKTNSGSKANSSKGSKSRLEEEDEEEEETPKAKKGKGADIPF